tara:strand:- start:52 stop:696 length:645 start_codon:yes stop_codon:yes gene_type:complete
MSEEQLEYHFKEPTNYGWIEIKLNDYLINHIWDCVDDAHGNAKPSLIGHIDKSLAIQDKNNILWDKLLRPLVIAYGNKWSHNHFKIPIRHLDDSYTFYLDQMWVNYQNQHEFNPVHNHGGVYSFAAWLKIPTDHQEQNQVYNAKDSSGSLNSAFCFHYTDSLGNIRTTIYEQYPKMEGTLLFFPARLNHEVYPYYECDEQRISISGNIWLKEKK